MRDLYYNAPNNFLIKYYSNDYFFCKYNFCKILGDFFIVTLNVVHDNTYWLHKRITKTRKIQNQW